MYKMDSKKLSVIIPVYNSAGVLEKCIESVLKQTYKDFNLYLVNDNSTDGKTGKICDAYAELDKRVHIIHHDKNCGLSLSREDGFHADDSEWVSFIDHDDLIAPYMYEEMMRLAYKYGRNTEMVCVRAENKISGKMNNPQWAGGGERKFDEFALSGRDACSQVCAGKINIPLIGHMWGKIIKRELIERALIDVLPYRERLYWVFFEDVMLTPMLFYHADKVVFENRLMYIHRMFRKNLSVSVAPKEFHYQAVEGGIETLRFFEGNNLPEAFERNIINLFLNMQSVWYKMWKNETDGSKKERYNQLIDEIFHEYGQRLKAVKSKDMPTLIKKINIVIFQYNRNLWGMTAGRLYFEILNRKMYG